MLKICSKHKKVIAFTVITFLFLSGWLNFQSDILDGSYAKAVSDGAKADLENKRVQLEAEIAELRREIDGLKIQVGQKESEKKNLKKEVDILNRKIKAIELEIKTTELEMERLSFEIDSTEEGIKAKEADLLKQKDFLSELMRALYLSDNKSLTEVLLEYDRLSDFWDEFQKNEALQENIKDTIE
ncbi:hypothetical protein KKA96_01110, partial [Patescibacteria group bacterium]|nr:hypothetical protein [Patescibacteria group bacterium]